MFLFVSDGVEEVLPFLINKGRVILGKHSNLTADHWWLRQLSFVQSKVLV